MKSGKELRALEDARRGTLQLTPIASARGVPSLPEDKVALFLSLFGARRSGYPKFWEKPKSGKKGYSPACANEWQRLLCTKPNVKCSECRHQNFHRLDAVAVEAHLRGTHTIGTYAIREDDSCIFATASLIGEGFDLPRLDTLFLTMPLSFKGRLIQYAGRLHREHAGKEEIRVYDYLDENHPITLAMFRRRATAYRQMGYRFALDESIGDAALRNQLDLFDGRRTASSLA